MKPYYQSDSATVYCADVLETLREIPDESVHCCVTSPPYWGLRDYGVKGQIGLEPDLQDYIAKMVEVFAEVRRVLRKDGTLWLNMGDCYASGHSECATVSEAKRPATRKAGARGGRRPKGWTGNAPTGEHTGIGAYSNRTGFMVTGPGLKPKDLVGQPWRLAFALQDAGWWLRSDIIWAKPNPMPESVTDRPTRAHEYVFLLTKAARYFYDADAIRERDTGQVGKAADFCRDKEGPIPPGQVKPSRRKSREHTQSTGTRNARSVWTIATQPYPEAHFATFPEKLIEPCVKAGTSERGCCSKCGAPWARQTKIYRHFLSGSGKSGNLPVGKNGPNLQGGGETKDVRRGPTLSIETLGWQPACDCEADAVPCTVLDCFAGAQTTGVVALKLGRHFVGIELSQEYLDDFGLDRLRAAETGLTAREVRAGQQALFNGGETT